MSSLIDPPPPKAKADALMSARPPPRQSKYTTLPHHYQPPPKDKPPLLPQQPKPPITAKFQDKPKAHRAAKRTSLPHIPLKASKPWPGSGIKPPATADELIRHMSNVPSYLQRAPHNNTDNVQGKALNVGVLPWGALQRYTGKNHSASATAKVTSPLSSHSAATTPKQRQQRQPTNCPRDLDPHHSTSTIHYRRSISQRNFEGGTNTPNGEERCRETVREGDKCFASNRSPTHREQVKKVQMELSGDLFADIQVKDRCTHIPYSCPLPRENSETCTTSSCSTSSNNSSSLQRENAEALSWEFTIHKRNTNGLNLSCTIAEPPSVVTRGRMSNVEAPEREAASSKRGRQSPLRRMLDPLLKPRDVASASHHDSAPVGLRRPLSSAFSLSSKKKECPTTCTESTTSITAPSLQPQRNSNLHFQQVEKVQSSMRQALLQLAWKGGLPVFMLSSGESDILGATVRRKCISDSGDNPELSYSIFTLQESKMKGSAVWIRPGNKGKKQHLVSNIVGEVRVSTCKSKCRNNSDICHVSREFVLVGPQLVPVSNTESAIHELEMESPVNMELAAIITNVPTSGSLCCKAASVGSVTAILPSGIHGVPARGEPSPLIERWRSGGGCDCGGWDEGCSLSVLSLVYNSEGSKSNWEETQTRFELFPQGHSKEEGHAFSMTCFKEGLYTVEFKSSVPLLQTFAICISLLHSRAPLKQETREEKTFGAKNGGPPSSYMQCHPPLSPVGRA